MLIRTRSVSAALYIDVRLLGLHENSALGISMVVCVGWGGYGQVRPAEDAVRRLNFTHAQGSGMEDFVRIWTLRVTISVDFVLHERVTLTARRGWGHVGIWVLPTIEELLGL